MADETTMDRIRKLLALADPDSGGTEAERNLAMERATELMRKHQIDVLMVEQTSGVAGDFVEEAQDTITARNRYWIGSLMNRIGRSANVRSFFYSGWYDSETGKKGQRWVLCGRPEQIAYVKALTDFLVPWLDIECEAAFIKAKDDGETLPCSRCDRTGYSWKDGGECKTCKGSGRKPITRDVFRASFVQSAVTSIERRLNEQKRKDEGAAGESITALVRNDEAALNRWMDEQHPDLRASRSRRTRHSAGGAAAGADAGNRADLSGGNNLDRGGRARLNA